MFFMIQYEGECATAERCTQGGVSNLSHQGKEIETYTAWRGQMKRRGQKNGEKNSIKT